MGNKMLLMFVMMVLIVVVGTALDFTPTVLILTPVLMPVVHQGRHRPGVLRRAVHHEQRHRPDHAAGGHRAQRGVRRGPITMDDAFKGVMPFFLAQLAVLFLLVFFPEIVLVPLQWWMR
jgi:TRAP-type C4-dicarboxylate transport system permease large subunit